MSEKQIIVNNFQKNYWVNSLIQFCTYRFIGHPQLPSLKRNYVVSYEFMTSLLMALVCPSPKQFHYEKMEQQLLLQSFVKVVEIEDNTFVILNKKRLKKYLKSNFNRFLLSDKGLEKLHKELIEKMESIDFDQDFV